MNTCSTSSGLKSSAGSITTQSSKVWSLTLIGGSAASTAILYDNASTNSGTVLEKLVIPANTTVIADFSVGIVALNGIYLDLAGTGAAAVVRYELSA